MGLLERDASLHELDNAWREAAGGRGQMLLLSGEAGVGKTTLVTHFTGQRGLGGRVLWGACDPLFTPRPLGPLLDMAAQADRPPGALAAALRQGADPGAIFAAFLDELRARPAIAVFEDVHWADEATLDLLRFLGRRVAGVPALILITYRDDELGPHHPLRIVLGDLASAPAVRRVTLPPLSPAAVQELVGDRPIDARVLHRQTGGNPFYVTEVLAAVGHLPPTVRDAVLARVARLSPAARSVLEAAAVIGARADVPLLLAVTGSPSDELAGLPAALEECLVGGMLLAQGNADRSNQVAFRHELAREAVLAAIPAPRRGALHRRVLAALAATPGSADLAELAHHAEAGGDATAVLAYAPDAARQAAATGAHRAAATLYELALRHAGALPPAELAPLLEAFAQECGLVDRRAEGAGACLRAAGLWRDLGQPVREGAMLATLANMLIGAGRNAEAANHLDRAITLLESHPPGPELAFAYRMRGALTFLDHDYRAGIAWSEKAITVSEALNDTGAILSARNMVGSSLLFLDYEDGCRYLLANMEQARAGGFGPIAAHAYANLGSASSELFHLRRAERYLREGIAFAAEHDFDRYRFYMTAWQAVTALRLGRWDEAATAAETVLRRPGVSVPSRITALAALGLLRARRGDAGAADALDEALELTRELSNLHRVGLVRAARAEAAWLAGDPAGAAAEAAAAYDLARQKRHPWFAGELAGWLHRAGRAVPAPDWLAEPYRAGISGDWRVASAAWERLRCPYEAALALTEGDQPAQMEALRRLEALGAPAAAGVVRRLLRAAGAPGIPRGPRPATRDNPYGLTGRQMEVLHLLAQSLTNAEIAARLQLSPKTVDHHVSAVLAKLDVSRRQDAAELARDLFDD